MLQLQRLRARRFGRLAVAAATGLALAACGSSGDGDTTAQGAKGETTTQAAKGGGDPVTLKFSYFTSQNNPIGQTWTWWMDEVTKRTDGSVTFDAFWDGTLLKADEVVDGLRDGRADVGQITPSFYSGRFPLTAVAELPFASSNVAAISATMAKLTAEDETFREEWTSQGVRPLGWSVGGASGVVSKKPIKTAADLRGKKIRGIDRGSKALKHNGANVLAVAPAELYGSMERGLLDAVYGVPFGALTSMKLEEVGDHAVDLGLGAQTASPLAISDKAWAKLSPEQQQAIEAVSAEVPAKYAELNAKADADACAVFTEKGVELFALPAAEVEKLRAGGEQKVRDEWVAELKKKDLDADGFGTKYRELVETAAADFPDEDKSGVQRCIDGQS